jgi:hypothetical protein
MRPIQSTGCPNCKGSSQAGILAELRTLKTELHEIKNLLQEKKKPPPHIGLGWAGSESALSRADIVSYCKRIEFCYKSYPHKGKVPFIPFAKTEKMGMEIAEKQGEARLREYVEHLEGVFERGEWGGFSRPERMIQHYAAWNDATPPKADQKIIASRS